jgi:hypothetical protein
MFALYKPPAFQIASWSYFCVAATTMTLEAAHNLSVLDLLRVLNEKLDLECTKIQTSPVVSTVSLESEVSEP